MDNCWVLVFCPSPSGGGWGIVLYVIHRVNLVNPVKSKKTMRQDLQDVNFGNPVKSKKIIRQDLHDLQEKE